MTKAPAWWRKPRRVTVVVDNPSWILPYAEALVEALNAGGDRAVLCRDYDEVAEGDLAFFLGCVKIAPPEALARHRRNLVVHESDLPRGRGFSPFTWQILEGRNEIPICLLEAGAEPDSGSVIYTERLRFEGHELIDELRDAQGRTTVAICMRFLDEPVPPPGTPQQGEPTFYARRTPADSRLDPSKSLAEQFDLLRAVDNQRYPAFFDHRGHRYLIKIETIGSTDDESD